MLRFAALMTIVLAAATVAAPALAAGAGTDCPYVGHMPNYEANDPPQRRTYDAMVFSVTKGDETIELRVTGATCQQTYPLKDGANPASVLEIQENYRDQLRAEGAELVFQDDTHTTAHLVKDGRDTWISVASQETSIDVRMLTVAPFKPTITKPIGNDSKLIGHMPLYAAGTPERRAFDQETFSVRDGDDVRDVAVRGAKFSVAYAPIDDTHVSTTLEIQENYRVALRDVGAQILFTDDSHTVAHVEAGGVSTWIRVGSQETAIDVVTIEEKALQLSIQPPAEAAMKASLEKDGRLVLYIPFDFDRATLRPEASPIIAQVVKLLTDNPALAIAVHGHTDNVGSHDYNVKLSEARAKAVLDAAVAAGIAPTRLSAAGVGPDQPIASNDTPEGRAKNRRVELVKF